MKRSGPLKRKTPLKPGKPLRRKASLKPGKALKTKTSLAPISPKRKAQREQYKPRRNLFLQENPNCQVKGCDRPSCDVQHKAKGNGERLLDESLWMAVCRECHSKIEHQERAWAYEMGYAIPVNRSPATPQPRQTQPAPARSKKTPSPLAHSPNVPVEQETVHDSPGLASG